MVVSPQTKIDIHFGMDKEHYPGASSLIYKTFWLHCSIWLTYMLYVTQWQSSISSSRTCLDSNESRVNKSDPTKLIVEVLFGLVLAKPNRCRLFRISQYIIRVKIQTTSESDCSIAEVLSNARKWNVINSNCELQQSYFAGHEVGFC